MRQWCLAPKTRLLSQVPQAKQAREKRETFPLSQLIVELEARQKQLGESILREELGASLLLSWRLLLSLGRYGAEALATRVLAIHLWQGKSLSWVELEAITPRTWGRRLQLWQNLVPFDPKAPRQHAWVQRIKPLMVRLCPSLGLLLFDWQLKRQCLSLWRKEQNTANQSGRTLRPESVQALFQTLSPKFFGIQRLRRLRKRFF